MARTRNLTVADQRRIGPAEAFAGGGSCPICKPKRTFQQLRDRDKHVLKEHRSSCGSNVGQIPIGASNFRDADRKGLVTDSRGFLVKRR
jgi:hypothetical protein